MIVHGLFDSRSSANTVRVLEPPLDTTLAHLLLRSSPLARLTFGYVLNDE